LKILLEHHEKNMIALKASEITRLIGEEKTQVVAVLLGDLRQAGLLSGEPGNLMGFYGLTDAGVKAARLHGI